MEAVTVVPDIEEPKAPTGSPLAALKARAAQAKAARIYTIEVPGLEQIVVRFNPLDPEKVEAIGKRAEKYVKEHRDASQGLIESLLTLVEACQGIYERDDSGELVPEGQYLTSANGSARTFANLGLANTGQAMDEVKALFTTEGDIIGISKNVIRFSGYSGPEALQDFRGN
jgi:hypothetical protein